MARGTLTKQRPAIPAIPAIPAVLDMPSTSLNALNGRLASKNEATTVAANHELHAGSLRTHQNMDSSTPQNPHSGPTFVETQPRRPSSRLDAHCPDDSGRSHIGGGMRQVSTIPMEQPRGQIWIGSSRQSRLQFSALQISVTAASSRE